ncbi:type II RES/Xre toxin-antitoxin system antitoxin [Spirosoma gilvum]
MTINPVLTPLQLIDRSRQGLAGPETSRVAGLLGVTDKEMARLLNQSVATFHRQVKTTHLDAPTSERLLLLTRLAVYGEAVFQDKGKFTRWLRRPLRLLENRSPLDLLDSSVGVQLVEDLLGRIDYGVFS